MVNSGWVIVTSFFGDNHVRKETWQENAKTWEKEVKGPTIMIGLLGPGREMGKKGEGMLDDDYSECPLATQDEIINKGNKQKAILTANYGPSEGEKKCGNCEYGEKLKGCGLGKDEVFCGVFEFKCAKENVCDAWDSEEEYEEERED